ncbi:uncharacterized protein Nmag_0455 [Natrialba magadii ATCC 43099]|uniref:DUF7344 domain-containing protein n=1 Tax=Natrialba magadii (strain ATCC 43099 / DSM 3394 / CCM 3739 / CIP 104546 / IAM 13178 / JCM 8861 / NBRC 102185 / NCIMB 2190 / MS3) TaxID=547559 RepID=D3SY03_NATMM|nr:hypothetical protein [Natrialba magadii]ADD04043.1 uncharacterized protein Nmag_0455 [Natrialba magadii ATCC 43099]ELY33201.1 hypothetical protein C500_02694 [Natrialba magadii ATCC 43099]
MCKTGRESTQRTVEATPSLDLIFELLSNRRRRYALYLLYEQSDGVATLEELTDAIVTFDRQYGDTPSSHHAAHADEQLTAEDQHQVVKTELQHVHLPKLEDAGILEHDRRSQTVRYWSQPSLEEWLEHAHHKEQQA